MNKRQAQYSIITDLKHSWGFGHIIHTTKFKLKLIYLYIKYLIKAKEKTKFKIEFLKKYKGYETGHKSLLDSLFRGFDELDIPYNFNKITKHTNNIILCWCSKEDISIIKNIYKKKEKKIITVPTACQYDYELQYIFPEYDCIDKVLVASKETKELYFLPRVKEKYINKVVPWASGVKIPENKKQKVLYDCICYYKKLPVNKDLINLLNSYNITFKNIEYGKYDFNKWIDLLDKVNFVIFFQDCIETQGLAMAEAWAHNRPTFIKTNDKFGIQKTSPYLTDQTGLFFESMQEIDKILQTYNKDKTNFINKFSPQDYVKENLSDKISVRKLIDIFNNIL